MKRELKIRSAVSKIATFYKNEAVYDRPTGKSTLRDFANALNLVFGKVGFTISRQTAKNWCDGRYIPTAGLLIQISEFAGWQGDFARDILYVVHAVGTPASQLAGEQFLAVRENE